MISWTQQLAGVGLDILREPHRPLPPTAQDKWVNGVRTFLQHSKCHLLIEPNDISQPRRINDATLMDLAMGLSQSDLLLPVQKVRLHLQVTFLFDVFNAKGSAFLPEVLDKLTITTSQTLELCPRQKRPPNNDWNTFLCFVKSVNRSLGPWLPTWSRYRSWTTVHCSATNSFWRHQEEWHQFDTPQVY